MTTRILLTSSIALATGAAALAQTGTSAPTAIYWMSAETQSGLAAMAGGATPAAMARGMMGGSRGAGHVHNLTLQLGSAQRPGGEAAAEHLPPAGLNAGSSLPLVGTRSVGSPSHNATPWTQMEKPRGRMLIYWGCGEKARAGQPVVVDFATMTAGKMPAAFANAALRPMVPPSAGTATTYGEWPNARSQARVPANGSLVGEHVVKSNYAPEMRFTLGSGQNFLAPVVLTANEANAAGAVPLAWQPIPGAKAFFGSVMGAAQNGDFIIWTSSETQAAMMAYDYIAEDDLARLVQNRTLMPASADRCTIPSEVARAAPQSMLSLIALGGESNFSQPRPASAARSWKPEWTAKLRTKSTHMGMLGMDMPSMSASQGNAASPAKPSKKDLLRKGVKGLLGR